MSGTFDESDEALRRRLTPEQYHIAREKGTERPFSGALYAQKAAGRYSCLVCGAELFDSQAKYDSGSGWPSFTMPTDAAAVAEHEDRSLGMRRIEVCCSRCGSHLGHVFPDGPAPTGLRYCINSAVLTFEPD